MHAIQRAMANEHSQQQQTRYLLEFHSASPQSEVTEGLC